MFMIDELMNVEANESKVSTENRVPRRFVLFFLRYMYSISARRGKNTQPGVKNVEEFELDKASSMEATRPRNHELELAESLASLCSAGAAAGAGAGAGGAQHAVAGSCQPQPGPYHLAQRGHCLKSAAPPWFQHP